MNGSIDLSATTELTLPAEVVRDFRVAVRADARFYVAGAFSRDLWLWYAHGIKAGRATEDLDFAVQCESWERFREISAALLGSTFHLEHPTVLHRFRHRNGTLIDLVPFGGLERADRRIAWPPEQSHEMNLLGFSEVLDSAVPFRLPGDVLVPAVSLPCLVALKLIAWQDRRRLAPKKDAADLRVILRNYADAGNGARLFDDIPGLGARGAFDLEQAGAELLGRDLAKQTGSELLGALRRILETESSPVGDLSLAREMSPEDLNSALGLLGALLGGIESEQHG